MTNARFLQILNLCRRITMYDEDYVEDEDTYAIGTLDALLCVLNDGIAEIENDIAEAEAWRARSENEQTEISNAPEEANDDE